VPRSEPQSSVAFKATTTFKRAAKRLGQRVRALRDERGLSLQGAAGVLGFDFRYIQRIEAGHNVTLATLLRLAEGFDVPVAQLLSDDAPPLRSSPPTPVKVASNTRKPRFTKKPRTT
jgi:transcriptional regulator with XRE-family HTH domain